MILSLTLTVILFGVFTYTAFTNHPDTLYFAAFFFLMLDNLKKSAKIQALEIAYLIKDGKPKDLQQLKDYEINVEIKRINK